jgi:predicted negative regulator of RcsB-dependent stress response
LAPENRVDEYSSEKEQIEQIRHWWRENGWFLVGGAAVGALLLFGWNQYQAYLDRQAEQAAALYQSLKEAVDGDSSAEATALLARLRAEYPTSSYADQGGLLLARMLLITSPELAVEELRYVMDNTDERELALIARLRLARVLAYRQQYDEALQVVEVDDPGQFAGRLNEVKGDIHVALGQADAARTAYLTAMTAPGSEALDRNFLQMKLNDLPPSAAVTSETPVNESPVGDVPATDVPATEPEEGA